MKLTTTKYRGKVAENCHVANAVAVNSKGEVLFSAGEENFPAFMSQTADYIRLVTLLEEKIDEEYDLDDEELAILASMHRGEDKFTKRIKSILSKIDLSSEDLLCPEQKPDDNSSYERLIIQGKRPTQVHNPSSGVHAGMLALEKQIEGSTGSYDSFNHPVQAKYLDTVKNYANTEKIYREIDDTGIPTFSLSLKNIASIYCSLIKKEDEYLQRVADIIIKNVDNVFSNGTFNHEFTEVMKGNALASSNKNGLQVAGIKTRDDFVGIAIQVLSGDGKAGSSMLLELMKHLKMIGEPKLKKLRKFYQPEQKDKSGNPVLKMKSEIIP
ncbi:MAG: asparaginase [Candidatus Marinimicrobia bacterium]|nr:asparaginase [Candidatus Neomarinimicrobiota bacterium]